MVPVPEFTDRSGRSVSPDRWGEMKLCWDVSARCWALHVSYRSTDDGLPGASADHRKGGSSQSEARVLTIAVDEGIINPMTLATVSPEGAYQVLVINGRSGRAAKQARNKGVAQLQAKMSRCQAWFASASPAGRGQEEDEREGQATAA
ncbi:hypothetical protein SGLAM104S_04715 [Streptomyces glaucescens]